MSSNWKLAALLATATAAAVGSASSAHAAASWDKIQTPIFGTWGKRLNANEVPGYYTVVNAFNNLFPFNANGFVDFTTEVGLDSSTAYARAYATLGGSVDMGPVHSGLQWIQYSVEPEVHMNSGTFNGAYGIWAWNSISNQYTNIDFNILFEAHFEKNFSESFDLFPAQNFDLGTTVPVVGAIAARGYVSTWASLSAGVRTDSVHGVYARIDAQPGLQAGLNFRTDQVTVSASFSPVGILSKATGEARVGEIRQLNNVNYVCAGIHGKAFLDRAGAGGMIVLTNWTVDWPFSNAGYTRTENLDFDRCRPLPL